MGLISSSSTSIGSAGGDFLLILFVVADFVTDVVTMVFALGGRPGFLFSGSGSCSSTSMASSIDG